MDPYQFLKSFSRFGSKGGYKPGLKRMGVLLEKVGHPEKRLKCIHVAGSNGKGSTIAFLNSIYRKAGYRVGVYTSPHLLYFEERIKINGKNISREELINLIIQILPAIKELGEDRPSFFEVVTSLAFMYFAREEVDVVLLETGLGGRLDATNVIPPPLAAVITSISLEHTSILGNSLAEIAAEKGGIIKENSPVITGVKEKKPLEVIQQQALSKGSPFINVKDWYDYNLKESSLEGTLFSLKYKEKHPEAGKVEEYFISLPGKYQVENAMLARAVVEILQDYLPVSKEDLRIGLKNAFLPARLEVITKKPLVLLDGAHNPQGIEVLVDFLKPLTADKRKIFIVIGVLKGKDIDKILKVLNFKPGIKLIITRNKEKRSMSTREIEEKARKYKFDYTIKTPLKKAIEYSLSEASFEDLICITGSLYTVAEAKKILKKSGIN